MYKIYCVWWFKHLSKLTHDLGPAFISVWETEEEEEEEGTFFQSNLFKKLLLCSFVFQSLEKMDIDTKMSVSFLK